jgi:hypothetical protein
MSGLSLKKGALVIADMGHQFTVRIKQKQNGLDVPSLNGVKRWAVKGPASPIAYAMEEIWSNRTYVALALFSLLATCVVF